MKLDELLSAYWEAAYAEGKEGRDHDTEDGVAQRTLAAIHREVAAMEEAADEIERLREEIGRLLDSREREGDRLDWLLARLPGSVIRDLVGVMNDTRDAGEWRDLIDKAACFSPYNARNNRHKPA